MKATYQVANRGNSALQTEVWAIPMSIAKKLVSRMDCRIGTYWQATLKRPFNIAKRQGQVAVRIYTGGFSTGELSNVLQAVGCEVVFAGEL